MGWPDTDPGPPDEMTARSAEPIIWSPADIASYTSRDKQRTQSVLLVQDRLQSFNLTVNHLQRRTSNRPPLLHARLKVKHSMDVLSKLVVQSLVILQGQLVHLTLPRLCKCDRPPRYVMGFAERDLP